MPDVLSVPILQMQLDDLVPGQGLDVATADVERMFGLNDVAAGRLRNFAEGHGCVFALSTMGVQFIKVPRRHLRSGR